MTNATANDTSESMPILPVSSTGDVSPQQAIHDGYIATIRKQREAALDTVANLVGERDFLLSRVQLLEKEASKVTILLQEISNLQNQIHMKSAHVFSEDVSNISKPKAKTDSYHNTLNP